MSAKSQHTFRRADVKELDKPPVDCYIMSLTHQSLVCVFNLGTHKCIGACTRVAEKSGEMQLSVMVLSSP
jgi:hypothetical protein